MTAEIDEQARRCWASKAIDSQMHCYLGMKGRVTLGELVAHFAEHYPHVDPMALNLNYATATWEEPPTMDDWAKRRANQAGQAERTARWERETYARLKAKFEPGPIETLFDGLVQRSPLLRSIFGGVIFATNQGDGPVKEP